MAESTPKPRNRRVIPLGNPLNWGQGDYVRMAQVSDSDKFDAVAFWQAHTMAAFRELLRAKEWRRRKAG